MNARNTSPDLESLETLDPDRALFEGRIDALVAGLHPGQRPLQGLAGLLDWRFEGAISALLRRGVLTGAAGECAYLPWNRGGTTYHLLLLGWAGPEPTERNAEKSLKALRQNVVSLKLNRVGVSRSDLGKSISALKGVPICILR